MNRPRPIARLLVAALAPLAPLAGCAADADRGYAFASAYRTDVRTVAAPIFDNLTYAHGIEADLAEALVKEIHSRTPWRVVQGTAAETRLTGVITDVDLRKLTTNSDSGLVQEMAVSLVVSFEWKRSSTGEVLAARRDFSASSTFVPARGAGERIAVGETNAVDRLARDIVASLRSSW